MPFWQAAQLLAPLRLAPPGLISTTGTPLALLSYAGQAGKRTLEQGTPHALNTCAPREQLDTFRASSAGNLIAIVRTPVDDVTGPVTT
jgi:hypothetical protein